MKMSTLRDCFDLFRACASPANVEEFGDAILKAGEEPYKDYLRAQREFKKSQQEFYVTFGDYLLKPKSPESEATLKAARKKHETASKVYLKSCLAFLGTLFDAAVGRMKDLRDGTRRRMPPKPDARELLEILMANIRATQASGKINRRVC